MAEAEATQEEIFVIPDRDPGLPAQLIDLTKFYNAHFAPEPGLEVVWRGLFDGSNVGLFKTTWTNPKPSAPVESVESVELVSAMNTPGPFVLAITVE